MTILFAIDPGLSSGVARGEFSDTEPLVITDQWQTGGGVKGFVDKFAAELYDQRAIIVCEKFIPRPNEGFNHTLKSIEPMRIEGWCVGTGIMPDYPHERWQQPAQRLFMGGDDHDDRVKRANEFLKKHGLYRTGSQLGQPDGDDANSATLHAIAFIRSIRHLASLRVYFKDD